MKTLFISHRGNLNRINKNKENTPDYIDAAISAGYDVEIDIHVVNKALFLGHDGPETLIDFKWLKERKSRLWIHCKNNEALKLMQSSRAFNYFWHQEDRHTLTSKGYVWSYPGNVIPGISITVVTDPSSYIPNAKGYCSDYIEQIHDLLTL